VASGLPNIGLIYYILTFFSGGEDILQTRRIPDVTRTLPGRIYGTSPQTWLFGSGNGSWGRSGILV